MPQAKVTGVRISSKMVCKYTDEEFVTFEAEITADFDKPPTEEEVVAEIGQLFKAGIDPAIENQFRQYGSRNKLFRVAAKLARPRAIKHCERMLQREDKD